MNVWKTRFLPQHAEVTTCNISGPIPPAGEFCTWEGNAEKDKSKLASSSDIQFTTHRTWLVPHKNQYRYAHCYRKLMTGCILESNCMALQAASFLTRRPTTTVAWWS